MTDRSSRETGAMPGAGFDLPAILARASVGRPGAVILVVAVLALLGASTAADIPVDAVPDVTSVQVTVLTRAGGFGPVEVERLVTQRVEVALAGIPGVRQIRSTSRTGISSVTVVFEEGTDPLRARLLVSQRLPGVSAELPSGTGPPELGPFTTALGEVYHFTVRWPGHSLEEVHTLVEWELAWQLRLVPGVVEVNTWGGGLRQYQVELDPARMAARAVTLEMVHHALASSNSNVGAGAIERNAQGVIVRGEGLLTSTEDIGRVVVRQEGGVPVLVRDVGRARVGPALPVGTATGDGRDELVYVMVQMVAGGSARVIVREVRARLDQLVRHLPPGARVEPFYDRAEFVARVLNTVAHNLLEGAALVIFVLLFALGDFWAGLLVASLIPLSVLIAALAVHRAGLSGNLMSLGALDFGLLVDGAIVVVEHAMFLGRNSPSAPPAALARTAASEVARPVAYGVAIIALVYVPVLALEGVEGKMFRPMAIVVLCALSAALALSLTLVPALVPFLVRRAQRRAERAEPAFVRLTQRLYRPVIAFALRHPWLTGSAVALLLAVAGALATTRGGEFVPRLDEGSVAIQLTRPPSTSIEEGARGTIVVEQTLLRFPEVRRVVSRVGSPAVATDLMGPEQADVFVTLRPPREWRRPYDRDALVNEMNDALRRALPGTEFSFTQPIEMRVAELLAGIRSDVGVRIFGEDIDTLRELGARVAAALRQTPGGADVRVEQVSGLPTLSVRPRSEAMARYGLHSDQVLAYIQALRAGVPVGRVFEGARSFDLVLRAAGRQIASAHELASFEIPLESGGSAALGSLATIVEGTGPAQVSHEGGRRRVVVEANVRGRDLASYVAEARARLDAIRLPPGYEIQLGGQYQNLARATRRLAYIVPLALAAILIMLRASLGRWSTSLLVFVNVPVAASGGVLALTLRGMPFTISAGVGFIALAGIAVLNGLVLCTEIDRRHAAGVTREEAARQGALLRLRPVLTTASVATLGFLPMALARGTGAEVQRPIATVVIGGLMTATIATLVLLPTLAARIGRGSDTQGK